MKRSLLAILLLVQPILAQGYEETLQTAWQLQNILQCL